MIRIQKGNEPASLTTHRSSGGTYETYADKDGLRASLHRDQKGICGYCMQRIVCEPLKMKIEHFQSQAGYANKQLVYTNLIGVCKGNEGKPPSQHHCDTKKANNDLSKSPVAPPDIAKLIDYGVDGKVGSSDPILNEQLESVLNLNLAVLVNNRKAVLDGFRMGGDPRTWTRSQFDKFVLLWSDAAGTGELKPFCGVALYWLSKRSKGPFRTP